MALLKAITASDWLILKLGQQMALFLDFKALDWLIF